MGVPSGGLVAAARAGETLGSTVAHRGADRVRQLAPGCPASQVRIQSSAVTRPRRPVLRYAAFSRIASGGNPAGVVLDALGLDDATMQRIAADVGYSETAFVTDGGPRPGAPTRVRYFSPEREVDFCGHASIATGIALGAAHGLGSYPLMTNVGVVNLEVRTEDDVVIATLESPPTSTVPFDETHLAALLASLGWAPTDLHSLYTPMVATAGNRHPVLVVDGLPRLADLDYDFAALRGLCLRHDWTTIQLMTPTLPGRWRARDPFPIGGVMEDPATGAAAAAFGGYLLATGNAEVGHRFTIEQGVEMGRPSHLYVEILDRTVRVSGTATALDT